MYLYIHPYAIYCMHIKDTDVGGLVRWKRGWRDLSANSDAVAPKLVTGTCICSKESRIRDCVREAQGDVPAAPHGC